MAAPQVITLGLAAPASAPYLVTVGLGNFAPSPYAPTGYRIYDVAPELRLSAVLEDLRVYWVAEDAPPGFKAWG